MEDAFIIAGLAKRYAALAGDIVRMQEQLRQKLINLESLDAAIRVLDADYPIETIKPKGLVTNGDWTIRGQLTRLIFSVLRNAPEPLNALEIAREIMTLKQMDTSNRKAVDSMQKSIARALRKKRKAGLLRSISGAGSRVVWELAAKSKPPPVANIPSIAC